MLQIVHPLSLVARTIHVDVDALAIGLIIDPVTLVDIAVDVSELSEAVCPIILPIALITSTIGPNLDAKTVTEPTDPLARILCTSWVCVCRPLLSFSIWIVRHVWNRLFEFDGSEVAAVSTFCLLYQGYLHTSRVAAPESLQSNYMPDMRFK